MLALSTEPYRPGAPSSPSLGVHCLGSLAAVCLEAVGGWVRPRAPLLACPSCQWVPSPPVTLPCGHTLCRPCCAPVCPECAAPAPSAIPEHNVTVKAAVEKWWPRQVATEHLRRTGHSLLKENHLEKALHVFNDALRIYGDNHLLLEARSEVLHKLNRPEQALQDAVQAVRLRPLWSKGYYRKGVVLASLGHLEEALISFSVCAALDRNGDRVKHDFTKTLQKLISPSSKRVPFTPWWPSNFVKTIETNYKIEEDAIFDSFNKTVISSLPMFECRKLQLLFDRIFEEIERIKKLEPCVRQLVEVAEDMKVDDFECVLCCRTLWRPVTTPCGHTYCSVCLDRCLDYSPNCPLCMTPLSQFVSGGGGEREVTVFIETALAMGLPAEYRSRLMAHRAEVAALSTAPEVSVFICTTAYPTVPCPLYVFEPRYRLLVRRAVENGGRQFGMAAYTHQVTGSKRFADYGTMLEIKDWILMSDGCSILSCTGQRRFRVISRSERDGYDTAQVQYLTDDFIPDRCLQEVKELHDRVRKRSLRWFENIPEEMKSKILSTFGEMPPIEENWNHLTDGPAWAWWLVAILPLGHHLQQGILKTTCLAKRLRAIEKTLQHFEEGPENSRESVRCNSRGGSLKLPGSRPT